jgi:hypothetical protein
MKNVAMIMHRAVKMRLPTTLIQRRRRGRISKAYGGSWVASVMGAGRATVWVGAVANNAGVRKRRPYVSNQTPAAIISVKGTKALSGRR